MRTNSVRPPAGGKKTRSVENPKREAKRRQKFAGVGVTVSEKNLALTQKWMRGKVSASSYWASRLRVISQCIADKKPDGECVFFLSVAPCVCLQPPLPPPRAPLLLLIFLWEDVRWWCLSTRERLAVQKLICYVNHCVNCWGRRRESALKNFHRI